LQQFLENTAYPLLEGSASFLLSWLIEGQRGYLETNPSTSPEHYFIAPNGKKASVSYSTTMDMSVIREVFSAVLLSADVSLFILFLKKTVFMSMQMLYDMDDVCSFAKV
jgi:alpha-L-fucosidase 2